MREDRDFLLEYDALLPLDVLVVIEDYQVSVDDGVWFPQGANICIA